MVRQVLTIIQTILNMNILVTGANGQLGQAIRAQSRCFQNHNIIFTDVIADDMLETILSIVLPIRMWKKRKQILKWQILSIVMP